MGASSFGSTRASRASMRASSLSFFRLLALISFTCLALATITSCPNAVSSRLTHGEWLPTSMAIRQRCIAPNACSIPFFVVATLRSPITSPSSASTQYRLVLSPRSIPIVARSDRRLTCFRRGLLVALFFFMVGLLFAPRVRTHWDSVTLSPQGGRPSHSISAQHYTYRTVTVRER